MAKAIITVNTDDAHKEALAKAAEAAGMSLSAYLLKAADERMMRDAAERYGQVLAANPAFAADAAATRSRVLASAAKVRSRVLARYSAAA